MINWGWSVEHTTNAMARVLLDDATAICLSDGLNDTTNFGIRHIGSTDSNRCIQTFTAGQSVRKKWTAGEERACHESRTLPCESDA